MLQFQDTIVLHLLLITWFLSLQSLVEFLSTSIQTNSYFAPHSSIFIHLMLVWTYLYFILILIQNVHCDNWAVLVSRYFHFDLQFNSTHPLIFNLSHTHTHTHTHTTIHHSFIHPTHLSRYAHLDTGSTTDTLLTPFQSTLQSKDLVYPTQI